MRLPACLFALAAVAVASGCGGDDDRGHAPVGYDDDPATSLTVVWEGSPKAKPVPVKVMLIGPSDQVVAKGHVADPTQRKTVFTHGMGGSMRHGYFLQAFLLGKRPSPACLQTIKVKHGDTVEATITPKPVGHCVVEN